MSNVWLCIPSKRSYEEVEPILKLWHERGYNVAMQRDKTENPSDLPTRGAWSSVEMVEFCPYSGYAEAVNHLALHVLKLDKEARWIVCAGDDTEPDAQHSAEEIAQQCEEYFLGDYLQHNQSAHVAAKLRTFGVMQPTGDRWGEDPKNNNPALRNALIDRVAGSPWMGREFCLRVNKGRGPLWQGWDGWDGYFHMGCDEELQAVATRLGVFWQRPDLIHLHKHWGRTEIGEPLPSASLMPEFLKRANSGEEWRKYKKLFAERQAAGFPGSEPL